MTDPQFTDINNEISPEQSEATELQSNSPKRIKATKNMISYRYRLTQFKKNAGIEILLILILFISLRHMFSTETLSAENKLLISKTKKIVNKQYSLKHFDKKFRKYINTKDLKANFAFTTTLPLTLITAITGQNNTTYLIFSLVLSIFTILFVYIIGKELYSPETGIASALFFTIFPAFIVQSTGCFTINFCFFYFCIALLLFIKAMKSNSGSNFFFSGIFSMAAVYSNPESFVFIILFPIYYLLFKPYKKNIFFLPLGIIIFYFLMNLVQIIFFKGSLFIDIKAFFHSQYLQTSNINSNNAYLNLNNTFNLLFKDPTIIPFSFLSIFAIGYTIRTNKTSFPFLPMIFFITTFLMLEFFPIKFTPYTTLAKTNLTSILFAPSIALLLGTYCNGIMNRKTIRWLIITITILSIPLLIFF